ncbi:hypothetical protein BHE74_00014054 [Ensete ventricosum]|uniref:R13L1/DRL21-like LRR repeat region domain-containing protein n=1 Tax=Ensete ventricosum TaxID=4639 RepID=A0A444F510_ENSVE|nr:hypothetical protein GW17_00018316 [Ensete ventricosum]RWW77756.1 hypothetical protein BHE74_00014054 [Ensete ventricosum]RZR71376.1 hypothetical protein BHM03_00004869 [Ensete ventricosum]
MPPPDSPKEAGDDRSPGIQVPNGRPLKRQPKWKSEMHVMYDADDIIDLCRAEGGTLLDDQPPASRTPLSLCCVFPMISCFAGVKLRYEIGNRVRSLDKRLDAISRDELMHKLEQSSPDVVLNRGVVNLLWKKAFVSGGEEDMENLKDTFPEIWHREVASILTTSPDSLWATKKMTGAEVSNGASVLFHQSHLTRLPLLCTPDTPYTEEETRRVFEELRPPPCWEEELWIDGFFGRRFPSWKMSSLGTSFPRLTRLFLLRCELCQQLPSLGQLPQLKYLHITAASATSSLETRRRKQHPPLSSRSSKNFRLKICQIWKRGISMEVAAKNITAHHKLYYDYLVSRTWCFAIVPT